MAKVNINSELTPYERWQEKKYKTILEDRQDSEEFENGIDAINKLAEDIEAYNEKEVYND